ncbi:MAG: disulfide bond formation protein DsbA [Catenulispora sp.]|nr:disulfide bond formation protein DsbA [Catenulispora sp.]
MTRPKNPRLYFSFRSPYSWIALRRLEAVLPDAAATVEYIPYWDADEQTSAALAERGAEVLYQQMTKAKHLYLIQDTKRIAARLGYQVRWPIDRDPWWELPHLGWLAARRAGVEREFYTAVTRARWEQGADVCDRDVLRGVCVEAGLDAEPLLAAPDDPDIRAEGVEALSRAYDEDIFGIPYFLNGRRRFWGLDRLGDFIDDLCQDGAKPSVPAPRAHGEPVQTVVDKSEPVLIGTVLTEPVQNQPEYTEPDQAEPALAGSAPYDFDTAGGCG